MAALPSHRAIINDLIASLSEHAPRLLGQDLEIPAEGIHEEDASERRRLLLTLHVLFPTLLLPALDLLDRKLVTRIIQPSSNHEHKDETGVEGAAGREAGTGLYIVQSLASTLPRRRKHRLSGESTGTSSPPKSYIVRLRAWHCSCASFAFESFPQSTQSLARPSKSTHEDTDHDIDNVYGKMGVFGGACFNGLSADQSPEVPCCKHVLAALLAETWKDALGSGIESRVVDDDELAGIVAGT